MAAIILRRSAELSDTSFVRGNDNGTRPGFDPEAAHPSEKKRARRRRRVPAGYLGVDDLVDSGEARSTIYRHIKNGNLAAGKYRGRLVVAEAAFRAWASITPLRNAGTDAAGDADEARDD